MHAHDGIPLIHRHVDQHAIAHNPRVADERVEAAERLNGLGDQATRSVPVADIVAVHDCSPTARMNLGDNIGRWAAIVSNASQ